ncbi:unnamed protein product [Didymodactylos carnosus]|uniref:Chitin-binding type-2 domain-containing protein n=1 Tax=Didymodactylos carnosus TaxID=1234261 RepID=A0A8S2DIQ8_9BILA|nr:unnamed protein product [Didymodactylos carnosus]CAF3749131.1 unnamed protein product [Didymodactylos carnosus]
MISNVREETAILRKKERKRAMKSKYWITGLSSILVPVMFGVFTIVTTIQQQHIARQNREKDRDLAKEQRAEDNKLADDVRMNNVLNGYFEEMSDIFTNKNISFDNTMTLTMIRAKTVTSLNQLDPTRKSIIIKFLYETKAITKRNTITFSVDLTDAELNNINMSSQTKTNANLRYLVFSGVSLVNASFRNRDLAYSNFSFSYLTKANFQHSNLFGVNFHGASLQQASFDNANVSSADFTNTDLSGSNINDTQLLLAFSISNGILPNGTYGINRNLLLNPGGEDSPRAEVSCQPNKKTSPNPSDSHSYYSCLDNGTVKLEHCSVNLVWDEIEEKCDFKHVYG